MYILKSYLILAGTLAIAFQAAANDLSSLVQSLGLSNDDVDAFSSLNSATPFNTSFASTPSPWHIDISPHFIAITKLKVALTRYTTDIAIPPWNEGPPKSSIIPLRDYWLQNYSWPTVQSQLNSRYNHFTTTVILPATNYTGPIPLHFVHHRSSHSNAIPLLFMHGTPGSFMEVGSLLEPLTDPPTGSPTFHVVAPSMPGYGFSLAPKIPGMNPTHTAAAMNELMLQLNYTSYVVQAGDWGGIVLRYLAEQHPANVVSALSNFFIVAPNATDIER